MVEGTAPGPSTTFTPSERTVRGVLLEAVEPVYTGPAGKKFAFIFNVGGGVAGQHCTILKPDGLLVLNTLATWAGAVPT